MTKKQLTIFLSVTALFLTLALGTATASPILIGTTETLILDDNYPLKDSKAGNDSEFNVNWLADNYTPPPPDTFEIPLNLTILGKYNVDTGWEKTAWGNDTPWFDGHDKGFKGKDQKSGDWSLTNTDFVGPIYYSLKASNEFALYFANGETLVNWNTSQGLSHISFWTASADASQVPEPSTIILFGLGCLGLAGIGRRPK